MRINIISVGKIKEKFFADAIAEYRKRLSKFCILTEETIADEKADDSLSPKEIEQVKNREGSKIISKIRSGTYVVSLAIEGEQLSSVQLANRINTLAIGGTSDITFIIGGSNGLSGEVIRRSDFLLSFSRMTFPHQLFKVMLTEQIYRAFKINARETYHK